MKQVSSDIDSSAYVPLMLHVVFKVLSLRCPVEVRDYAVFL